MRQAKLHDMTTERGRITARVPQSVVHVLESAAMLVGSTLNQFVTQAALEKAEKILEKEQVKMSKEDVSWLFSLLENPPAPTVALVNDFSAYKARKVDHAGRNPIFEFNP